MRIVLFHYYSTQPTPAYREIALALRARNHQVWVGNMDPEGNLVWHDGQEYVATIAGPAKGAEALNGLPIVRTVFQRAAYFEFMRRVRKFFATHSFDIVQVNPVIGSWVLPFNNSRTRFILDVRQTGEGTARGVGATLRDWQAIAAWRFSAKYRYHHACFLHEKSARRILGADWKQRASIVPLGVQEAFLNATRQIRQVESGEPIQFVYIGTLSRLRFLERIFHATALMLQETDQFRIVFYGADEAQGYYQTLLQDMGLEPWIRIEPPLPHDQVPNALAKYDIALGFVPNVPAWRYQPTLKISEYKALGLPILATDLEPNHEFVLDGETGLLVQDTVTDLAAAMIRLVRDRKLVATLSNHASRQRGGITWAKVAELYENNVYLPLLVAQAREHDRRAGARTIE